MLILLAPVLKLLGLAVLLVVIGTLSRLAPAYGFLVMPVMWTTTVLYVVHAIVQARR